MRLQAAHHLLKATSRTRSRSLSEYSLAALEAELSKRQRHDDYSESEEVTYDLMSACPHSRNLMEPSPHLLMVVCLGGGSMVLCPHVSCLDYMLSWCRIGGLYSNELQHLVHRRLWWDCRYRFSCGRLLQFLSDSKHTEIYEPTVLCVLRCLCGHCLSCRHPIVRHGGQ